MAGDPRVLLGGDGGSSLADAEKTGWFIGGEGGSSPVEADGPEAPEGGMAVAASAGL